MPIDLTSPTRLAEATAPLVDPEAVHAYLLELGENPGPVTEAKAGIYDRYAALLACFTPRLNPYRGPNGETHDSAKSPNHYSLKHRLQNLSGDYLTENEAKAVGRALGIDEPSVTAKEGRWIWNVANRGTTAGGGYPVAPPREWEALVDFLGITVTRDGDRIEFTPPARS